MHFMRFFGDSMTMFAAGIEKCKKKTAVKQMKTRTL